MNEVQINESVTPLTRREVLFLVQLSMAYECAGRKLSGYYFVCNCENVCENAENR